MYLFFSFYFRYIISCTLVLWSFSDRKLCTHLLYIFDDVVITFHLSFHMLFLFSLYTHISYLMYAILYFCCTLRCLDEFCLKCFRNIGCQSLLAINSLLAKIFKSLCYDKFYCNSISEYELSDLWLLSYVYLFIVVLLRIAKGGDC